MFQKNGIGKSVKNLVKNTKLLTTTLATDPNVKNFYVYEILCLGTISVTVDDYELSILLKIPIIAENIISLVESHGKRFVDVSLKVNSAIIQNSQWRNVFRANC